MSEEDKQAFSLSVLCDNDGINENDNETVMEANKTLNKSRGLIFSAFDSAMDH